MIEVLIYCKKLLFFVNTAINYPYSLDTSGFSFITLSSLSKFLTNEEEELNCLYLSIY